MIDYCKELDYYLGSKVITGGLLLTGKWGSGKTYFIKEYKDNNKDKYAFAIISMFGVGSAAELHQKIKEEYLSVMLGVNSKSLEKVLDVTKKVTGITNDTVGKIKKTKAVVQPAVQGITSLVASVDLYSFIDVKSLIKDNLEFVLVFDDFERSSIPIKERMGLVNYYVENKEIKTIIIADEDKVSSKKYKEFKEKVISKTLYYSSVPEETISSIVNKLKFNSSDYSKYVKKNILEFVSAFKDSGYFNYRALKNCLVDYQRVYDAWAAVNGIEITQCDRFIYEYCARVYETKAGKYVHIDSTNSFAILDPKGLGDTETIKKYREETFSTDFYSVSNWIVNGEWDSGRFGNELLKKYVYPIKSPADRILEWTIYELEQADIDSGLPSLLEKAYSGELSRDELIALLSRLFSFEECGVKLPCRVDYSKIEAGFDKRCEEIKSGVINEPESIRIIDNSSINKKAHRLNQKINELDKKIVYWNNRKRYIEAMQSGSYIEMIGLQRYTYEAFDEEMCEAFSAEFFKANNFLRKRLSEALLSCHYVVPSSSRESIKTTVHNLEKIKSEYSVTEDEHGNDISCLATIEFIKKLDKVTNEYRSMIKK